jgi:hypothetical protein
MLGSMGNGQIGEGDLPSPPAPLPLAGEGRLLRKRPCRHELKSRDDTAFDVAHA